jgi:hypothetical protein
MTEENEVVQNNGDDDNIFQNTEDREELDEGTLGDEDDTIVDIPTISL